MSLFGGIISGALQGAGDAGQQVAAQQAKVWDQEAINQQMADLDVQKQASLMALQFQQKQRAMNSLYPDTGAAAAPVGAPPSSAPAGSPATPAAAPPSPVANYADHPGFDPSQHSPEALSAMQKSDPVAYANGLNDFLQWQKANPQSQGSPIATPAAASSPQQSAPPVVWKPSRELASAAMSADIISPGAGAKLLEANAPDATGKMLLQMGVLPDSPAWHAGYAAHQFKENSENVRPGGIVMSGGKPVFAAPSNGVITNFDANGNPSAALEQGYAGAAGAVKAAELAATNTQNLAPPDRSLTDGSGRIIPTTIAGAIAAGQNGTGVGNSPAQMASFKSNDDAAAANAKLPDIAVKAKQTVSALEGALQLAKTLPATGPGTVQQNKFWSQMANVVPGITPGDNENNYQLMTKFLNNAQSNAAGATGADRSDQSAGQFGKGQANSETLNIAPLVKAIQYTLSQQDAAVTKDQFIANTRSALSDHVPNPDLVAQQAWSSAYDPKIFEFSRMDPADRSQFKASLIKQDPTGALANEFGAKYNQFHAKGWVQ